MVQAPLVFEDLGLATAHWPDVGILLTFELLVNEIDSHSAAWVVREQRHSRSKAGRMTQTATLFEEGVQ